MSIILPPITGGVRCCRLIVESVPWWSRYLHYDHEYSQYWILRVRFTNPYPDHEEKGRTWVDCFSHTITFTVTEVHASVRHHLPNSFSLEPICFAISENNDSVFPFSWLTWMGKRDVLFPCVQSHTQTRMAVIFVCVCESAKWHSLPWACTSFYQKQPKSCFI